MKLIGAALRGALWGETFRRAIARGEASFEDMDRVSRGTSVLSVGGRFHAKLVRDGEVIDEWDQHNLIVNQGLDHILTTEFCGGPPVTQWYMGLFGNNYTPVGTDTAASFPNNSGELNNYQPAARPAYSGIEGSQQVSNGGGPASFTFSSPATVYGAFIASTSGIGSTAGVLFAAAQFASPKSVAATDQLLLTYVLAAQSGS